jgi:uncharacterized protein (TIGR03382 family)
VQLCDLPEFAVTQQPGNVVTPNSTATFEITFTPSEDADYQSCFFFASNDADNDVFEATMEGYGYAVQEEVIDDNDQEPIDEEVIEDQDEPIEDEIDDNNEYIEDDEYVEDDQNVEDEMEEIVEDEPMEELEDGHQNEPLDENDENLQDDNHGQQDEDAERINDDSFGRMAGPCGAGGGSAGLMSMALMAGLSFAGRRRRIR